MELNNELLINTNFLCHNLSLSNFNLKYLVLGLFISVTAEYNAVMITVNFGSGSGVYWDKVNPEDRDSIVLQNTLVVQQ
jgi:hypothetical protein